MTRLRVTAGIAAVGLAMTVAACGGSSDKSSTTNTGGGATATATETTASKPISGTITVSTWGGDYTDAEKKYFGDAFTKDTGVKVKYLAGSQSPMAPVMLQAQSGDMKIDVVDAESPEVLHKKGLLADFSPDVQEALQKTSRPDSFTPWLMKIGQTAVLIACNPDLAKKCPNNPKEFWDVKNFPGTRGILVGLPQTVLDFASVADGIPPDKVYPMDIERAINKLKQIKPDVKVWPQSPSQAQQVLVDKEVAMEFLPHGSAYAVKEKIPNLKIAWDGAMSTNDGMVVTKDAPNKDAAMAYIKWIAEHPEAQAKWAKAQQYSTPSKDLDKYMSKADYEKVPAAHNVVGEDDAWLVDNLPKLQKAFQQFLAG